MAHEAVRALHTQLVSNAPEVLLMVASATQVEQQVDGTQDEAHPAYRNPEQPADQH